MCLKGTEGLPATASISLKAKVIGYLLGTRSVACEVTGNYISKTEVGAYRLTLFLNVKLFHFSSRRENADFMRALNLN